MNKKISEKLSLLSFSNLPLNERLKIRNKIRAIRAARKAAIRASKLSDSSSLSKSTPRPLSAEPDKKRDNRVDPSS